MTNQQFDQVSAFRAPDGKVFFSKAEIMAHVNREFYVSRAEEYVKTLPPVHKASHTRIVNTIVDYLGFEAAEEAEEAAA